MTDFLPELLLLLGAALAASTLAAVAGFGGAAILLPVLVVVVGPRNAIPALTIAQLVGNGTRVVLNRDLVQTRIVAPSRLAPLLILERSRRVRNMPTRAWA